jgi:hypothetical protein
MTCTECADPVHACGLCNKHYQRRRRGTLTPRRVDKTMFVETRDLLNSFRGAEKALLRLQRENTDADFSDALRTCRERIEALQTCPTT